MKRISLRHEQIDQSVPVVRRLNDDVDDVILVRRQGIEDHCVTRVFCACYDPEMCSVVFHRKSMFVGGANEILLRIEMLIIG